MKAIKDQLPLDQKEYKSVEIDFATSVDGISESDFRNAFDAFLSRKLKHGKHNSYGTQEQLRTAFNSMLNNLADYIPTVKSLKLFVSSITTLKIFNEFRSIFVDPEDICNWFGRCVFDYFCFGIGEVNGHGTIDPIECKLWLNISSNIFCISSITFVALVILQLRRIGNENPM